jgi:hypothetical protein
MWEPLFLTILWASTACYRDSFVFWLLLFVCGSTDHVDLGRFFSFLIYTQSVGLLRRRISPSQGRYLHTGQHKQNKCTETSTPRVGFETTIPMFERTKTVHALDRAATVIGSRGSTGANCRRYSHTGLHDVMTWKTTL